MPDSKRSSGALSLNTLVGYTPSNSTDDAPPRYRDAVPHARREHSPSRSSFFSSPPMSASEWTSESVSEFSEQQPFLSGSRSDPPPEYPGSRPSIALSVDEFDPLDEEVGVLLSGAVPTTESDDPRKGRRGCRGRRGRRRSGSRKRSGACKSRYSKGERFRIIISVIFVCFLLGFILGFIVVSLLSRHDLAVD